MLELILSLAMFSNEPLFLREPGPPYANFEIALNVEKELNNRFYMKLYPYMFGEDRNNVGRAGAFLAIGYIAMDNLKIELYHHSSHNLDNHGQKVEVDGVRMKWRLF